MRPEILSLSEMKVSIDSDVRHELIKQYSELYKRDSTISHYQAWKNAKEYTEMVLNNMKVSPTLTVCRVNLIKATTESVVTKLQTKLESWIRQRSIKRSETFKGPIAKKDNKVCLKILASTTFDDCIEIGWYLKTSSGIDKPVSGLVWSMENYLPETCNTTNKTIFMSGDKLQRRSDMGWPESHRVVIVDRFCGEAVMRGSEIFVCGVLCADSGIKEGDEVAVYANLKRKGVKVTRGTFLDEYMGCCVFLGVGVANCSTKTMFKIGSGVGVFMSQGMRVSSSDHPPLNAVLSDEMMLQNLPSIAVSRVLNPQPHEVILDMCCCPGGKTLHLASLVNNQATIIACDKSRKKVLKALEKFKNCGAYCIIPLALDSTDMIIETNNCKEWKSVKEVISAPNTTSDDGLICIDGFYPESFDRILLDPPCTALGLRPKFQVDITINDLLKNAPEYQRRFVDQAVVLLKPGGIMTYSTCTINALENEDMVRYILHHKKSKMNLVAIDNKLFGGVNGLPGNGLTEDERKCVCRFVPSNNTSGFFLAKFIKCL